MDRSGADEPLSQTRVMWDGHPALAARLLSEQGTTVANIHAIDPMHDFDDGRLPPVPVSDAIKRVRTFLTSPRSGYGPYDLAGGAARRAGQFKAVAPWSLLWADAL